MWNKEPELYRKVYHARKGTGNQTRRKSLRTTRYGVAVSRLIDLNKFDKEQHLLLKDIFTDYKKMKDQTGVKNNLQYIWNVLEPYFGHLRPDQISRETCMEYRELRQDKSKATILRELTALRAAVNWFDPHNKAVFYMPTADTPKFDCFHRDEIERMLQACEEPHIELFITLSIATGARKSAVLQLTWDNIDFERGLINLGDSVGNKKRAIVPMNFTARRVLKEAYKTRVCSHIIEYNGKPLKDIKRAFQSVIQRAEIERRVNPHMLRKTAAVFMAEGGASMSEIAQFLGHKNSKITEEVYARFSPTYLQNAASHLELGSYAPRVLGGKL